MRMDNGTCWFCYLAINDGLLSRQCCEDLLAELGDDVELLTFAQAVVDQQLCTDIDQIQQLLDAACTQAADGPPPDSELEYETGSELDSEAETIVPAPAAQPQAKAAYVCDGASIVDCADWSCVTMLDGLSAASAVERMQILLQTARQLQVSDVHLSAGSPPFLRHQMRVQPLGSAVLSADAAAMLNLAMLDAGQREIFAARLDFNLALQLSDNQRYRVNLMQHKQGIAGTYHVIPDQIRSLPQLGFSNHATIAKLLDHHNGLILVTGPAGSGKTTTLAALVDILNSKRRDHIITIEDPIEILHHSRNCSITQRQIGIHTQSYASALKGALREDPDVIVIGELHDLETIEMAITAAETGHLVIGTLHTADAASTLNRLLDVFPPSQQQQIRAMTSESLRGILCQKLLPRADGSGLIATGELLINTIAVATIIREARMHHLPGVMQTGSALGMRSMDQAVYELWQQQAISTEVARRQIHSSELLLRLDKSPAPSQNTAAAAADGEHDQNGQPRKKGWFR